eukprot:PITA_13173
MEPSVLSVAAFVFLFILVRTVNKIWWKPLRMKKFFESQGISGPQYRLLYGNTMEVIQMMEKVNSVPMERSRHDILPRVLPEIHYWTNAYGENLVYWFGPVPRIVIPQPELIRELLCYKSCQYEKPEPTPQLRQLSGDGLANSRGEKWARQRRLISPAFHAEALKSMVPVVVASATNLFDKWDQTISSGLQEIEVLEEFRNLTADVIARTAFGSSYMEGKHIFNLQTEQAILVAESFRKFIIPGYRFLPTRNNLKGRRLDREIQRSLRQIITNRKNNATAGKVENPYGKDLLGLMMAANNDEVKKHLSMSFQDMIDECKTFFVAGHETTSILLAWTVILLAMHTDWQELARNEVLSLCNNAPPNAEVLSRLKTVNMVLHEVLRLYPPLPLMVRRTSKTMKLGSLTLPQGTEITIPIAAVHHDKELWGEDAIEFKPQRFCEGVSKASKHPMAFMPFGLGPRICVGMNFSMVEAKVVLAMLLQRFSFVLSPAYTHAPAQNFTIRPQHGAQLVMHKRRFVGI